MRSTFDMNTCIYLIIDLIDCRIVLKKAPIIPGSEAFSIATCELE